MTGLSVIPETIFEGGRHDRNPLDPGCPPNNILQQPPVDVILATVQTMTSMFRPILLSLLLLPLSVAAFAQSDSEHMAVAQQALLAQPPECAIADQSLERVTPAARTSPFWVYYKAQAQECLRNYAAALEFYRQYDAMQPGHPEVLERIGRVGLALARAQRDEEARRAQAAAERARVDSVAERRQNLSGVWQSGGGLRLEARNVDSEPRSWIFELRFVPALHDFYGQARPGETPLRGRLENGVLSAEWHAFPTPAEVEDSPECRGLGKWIALDLTVSADGNSLQGQYHSVRFFTPDDGTTCQQERMDNLEPLSLRRTPE